MGEPAQPVDTGSTCRFKTLSGAKTYHQVADLIAEPLRRPLREVVSGHFAKAMDVDLLGEFPRRILIDVMPDIAGRWRTKPVRMGGSYPPEHAGYANMWGFAIYRAGHNDCQNSYLPTGYSAENALDSACSPYLADPTAWPEPPTN